MSQYRLFSSILVGVGALVLSGSASAQITNPYITATASARYQDTDAGTQTNTTNFPQPGGSGTASAHRLVPKDGATTLGRPDRVVGFDDAEGQAFTNLPGVSGALARSGGWSPGPNQVNETVRSSASTTQYTNWMASGSGSSTMVNLVSALDGWFYVGGSGSNVEAKVSMSMTLHTLSGSTSIFNVGGVLNQGTGFSSTFNVGGASSANWDSAWEDTSSTLVNRINPNDKMWDLDYTEVFANSVTVPLNELFAVEVTMSVEANNDEGPFEIFATSDFYNTSSFDLTSSNPNVDLRQTNLAPVPEPATITVCLAAFAASIRRRRKAS